MKKPVLKENPKDILREDFCPKWQEYSFVSQKECEKAGRGVMDLVLGKTEIAVPIRNTEQQRHNDRMYELEKEKYEPEKEKLEQQRKAELQKKIEAERQRNREIEAEKQKMRQEIIKRKLKG